MPCSEKKLIYQNEYRRINREEVRRKQREYRKAHPSKPHSPGYSQKYYLEHRDEILFRNRARYTNKREECLAAIKLYQRTPKARFASLLRGAKARGHAVDLTFEEWLTIIEGANCRYCGGALPACGGGIDRKDSTLGYSKENSVPACRECNLIRGPDRISYEEMFEVVKLLRRLRRKRHAA